jgi:hypothetical protein
VLDPGPRRPGPRPETCWVGSASSSIRASRVSRRLGGSSPSASAAGGGQQLPRRRSVAARAGVDPRGQLGRRPAPPGCRASWAGHLGRAEAGQLQPLDPAGPVQLGQERPQGVAAVELVGAVGQRPAAAGRGAGCGPGRRAGRGSSGRPSAGPRPPARPAARPSRSSSTSSSSNSRPCSDQPAVRRTAGPIRASPSEPAAGGPARGGARASSGRARRRSSRARAGSSRSRTTPRRASIRGANGTPLAAQLDAAADQHGRPGWRGRGHHLADQPGLADPGLAADQHRRRGAGRRPGRRPRPAGPAPRSGRRRSRWLSVAVMATSMARPASEANEPAVRRLVAACRG